MAGSSAWSRRGLDRRWRSRLDVAYGVHCRSHELGIKTKRSSPTRAELDAAEATRILIDPCATDSEGPRDVFDGEHRSSGGSHTDHLRSDEVGEALELVVAHRELFADHSRTSTQLAAVSLRAAPGQVSIKKVAIASPRDCTPEPWNLRGHW
jgi:hypothetical protein